MEDKPKKSQQNLYIFIKEYARLLFILSIFWGLIYLTQFFAPFIFNLFFDRAFTGIKEAKNIFDFVVNVNNYFWWLILFPIVLNHSANSLVRKLKE